MCSHCLSGFSLSEAPSFIHWWFSSTRWCFPKLCKYLCYHCHKPDPLWAQILTLRLFLFAFFIMLPKSRLLYQHLQWQPSWLVGAKHPTPLLLQPPYPSRPCSWETGRSTVTKLRCTFELRWYKPFQISQALSQTYSFTLKLHYSFAIFLFLLKEFSSVSLF